MGQQISLKIDNFIYAVDKVTYIDDEMSKFVNKSKPCTIELPD